jgi:ribose transport system permease protein
VTSIQEEARLEGEEFEGDLDEAPRQSWWARIVLAQSALIGLILLGLLVGFSILEPSSFDSVANARNIATDASILLVLSVGEAYVIITAGIDLSIGAVLIFSGVVADKAMVAVGGESVGVLLLGLLICLGCGIGWGALNGVLVAKTRISPLIATLGTFGIAEGLAFVLTGGVDLSNVPMRLVTSVGAGRAFNEVPWLVIIALATALVFGVILRFHRFGRHTYAIGSSEEAALRAGISVDRHLIKVYALAGCMSGLAGYLSLARFATTTIAGHETDNLRAITAVVIGGTSLFGGIGTMLGTVFGVFIPTVLQNGFVIVGVQPFWQQAAVGTVLIVAVIIDRLRRSSQR